MTKNFERLSIGDRLRYLIEVRRYTQVELAKKVGVTQAALLAAAKAMTTK